MRFSRLISVPSGFSVVKLDWLRASRLTSAASRPYSFLSLCV